MSEPSALPQHKENITAVTPSKPNFLHIGRTWYIVVQLTLVMVLVVLSVIVREAMI
jgi:hypothetical protein